MATDTSISNKPADVFKTYPEFSKLTLGDRKKYEALIADFPPIEDLSFVSLMTWWNTFDSCAVAQLNGNLIISYWLPAMERYSGLSVVGTKDIDATICTVFDIMRAKGEQPRLMHVPEFVTTNIEHPELFKFKPMRAFDEYITPVSVHYPLRNMSEFRRKRVRTFLKHTEGSTVVGKSLDLSDEANRELLLDAIHGWPRSGKGNNFSQFSDDNTAKMVRYYELLGIENYCLFVDGVLQGYFLYHLPADKRYIVISHVRTNSEIAYTFEYLCHAFGGWAADQGLTFINMTYDVGLQRLRTIKLSLEPSNFFRKYIVEPAD